MGKKSKSRNKNSCRGIEKMLDTSFGVSGAGLLSRTMQGIRQEGEGREGEGGEGEGGGEEGREEEVGEEEGGGGEGVQGFYHTFLLDEEC